jgi:hypothetical protein
MTLFKKIILLTVLFTSCLFGGVRAQQTTSFNFSLTSKPVSGWTNMMGDPVLAVRAATDATTGISISSVSKANWSAYTGFCAKDSNGVSNGTFFPAGVMYHNWFQYSGTLAIYNAAIPQFIISGLNVDSVYTLKMTGSSTSSFVSNPTRYTVMGATVYGYADVNCHNNISSGATINNVAPDDSGRIKVYVNTISTTNIADICGIQIIRQRTAAPVPVVTITSPSNNDMILEDKDVVINATATETGGAIKKVEFYANGSKLGEDSVSPYTYTMVKPNVGNYALTARAIDTLGSTSTFSINIGIESLNDFWSNTGNIAANGDSNFIGTVDTNRLSFRTNNVERMTILKDGTIGIGTKATYGYQLAVNGSAIFTKVKVKTAGTWPDYVFKPGYQLPDLLELERYLVEHKHLPGIASEGEVAKDGIDVGGHEAALLQKVEELTLYLIQEHKELEALRKQVADLQQQVPAKK